jgi:uncharacterized protein (TIGR02996 family)
MAPTDPESTALRAALTADPTDVTLRLVYADRLDEAGDPALAALWRWLGETRRFPRRADQRDRVVRTLGPGPLAASIVERMAAPTWEYHWDLLWSPKAAALVVSPTAAHCLPGVLFWADGLTLNARYRAAALAVFAVEAAWLAAPPPVREQVLVWPVEEPADA